MIILFVPKLPRFLVVQETTAIAPPLAHGRTRRDDLSQAAKMASMNTTAISILGHLSDVAPYLLEWVAALVIIMIHTLLTFLLKVPGCPTGTVCKCFSLVSIARIHWPWWCNRRIWQVRPGTRSLS